MDKSNNQNPEDFDINNDPLKFGDIDIEKIEEIIRNLKQKRYQNESQNTGLKDYIDFNDIFEGIEKKDEKDILPNFIESDIFKEIKTILDNPYSTIIYADQDKKAILTHIGLLLSFFSYYSNQFRYLYKTSNNVYLKELIKRVLAKNDGYLSMALELYKIETSIYVIKDNQPIISPIYQSYQNQNYGNQYQNK